MELFRPHFPSPCPRRAALAVLALAVTSACQSYEARPLDPPAHREAWQARTLEGDSLAQLVARLETVEAARDVEFDPADGLSLAEGRLVALVYNPDLRLARLRVQRALATAENAGLWADPQLSFTLLNITEGIPNPWFIAPGLAFSIPLSGRLGIEEDLADAGLRAELRRARESEWRIELAVRQAWIEWSAAQLVVEENERLVAALGRLNGVASQLADLGELPRPEATLFAVEEAQRRNRLLGQRGAVLAAEQRLRALLGLAPDAPVELLPTFGERGRATDGRDLTHNLTLARLADEYTAAEEALRLEIALQTPDLWLGPQYERDAGQDRVGLFGWITLPLWNANKLAIAEAQADREVARAAYETEIERLLGRLAAVEALRDAFARQRAELEEGLVPLVDRQVTDAGRLMQLGEGTSLVLLESLMRAQATKLSLIEVHAAEARAEAELDFLVGPAPREEPAETESDDDQEPTRDRDDDTPTQPTH